MKRLVPTLLLVAAFALGAGATKLAWFPYVSDELNQSCQKTVFEWQVMANRIDTTPVPLNANFDLIRLEGEPKKEGLIVRAYARPKKPSAIPEPNTLAWNNTVCAIGSQVKRIASKRFGIGAEQSVFVLTHIGDRLVEVRGNGKSRGISPSATREEQLATLASIMSQASPLAP